MKMNKTVRYILYGVIVAICIISIFIGVYALEFRISGQKNIAGSNAINEQIMILQKSRKCMMIKILYIMQQV